MRYIWEVVRWFFISLLIWYALMAATNYKITTAYKDYDTQINTLYENDVILQDRIKILEDRIKAVENKPIPDHRHNGMFGGIK